MPSFSINDFLNSDNIFAADSIIEISSRPSQQTQRVKDLPIDTRRFPTPPPTYEEAAASSIANSQLPSQFRWTDEQFRIFIQTLTDLSKASELDRNISTYLTKALKKATGEYLVPVNERVRQLTRRHGLEQRRREQANRAGSSDERNRRHDRGSNRSTGSGSQTLTASQNSASQGTRRRRSPTPLSNSSGESKVKRPARQRRKITATAATVRLADTLSTSIKRLASAFSQPESQAPERSVFKLAIAAVLEEP
ncbi:hypothetical protein QBC46DRAFT_428349 [Diplogelasinospora grovesii]|uniref:Uncharacterized protein n=1 Tax=Diplogelasinospora grovesii TaxID=303347 RepID=A0AAN6NC58_9PEZI|nr:hypothetical protein QBC46DRAFT_428349 [Diplogelasinospora grovesii]